MQVFLDKNREYLFANSEQHVWNVCINWSYLIEISRLIAWKVGSFKASGDLLILNSFRFLRRHEFIICIFELRIFQKFYSKEHLKEIFGPMKEDWKFKNSFFGDEYNLIISVALFPINYKSYNIFLFEINQSFIVHCSYRAVLQPPLVPKLVNQKIVRFETGSRVILVGNSLKLSVEKY